MDHSSTNSSIRRVARHRAIPVVAAGAAVALAAGAVVSIGDSAAGASTTYKAQSVGRFLDGQVGGKPIQSLADVQDARAKAPGSTSAQNALNATLLGKLSVPLGTALHLPGAGIAKLGAANQVAVAKTTGYSYGGSGAVSNGGGISLGGSDSYPADATIDLSTAALGSVSIPGVPKNIGGSGVASSLDALGGVSATIGAVSGLAKTSTGGKLATPSYQIAGLDLKIGSPALGGLLETLSGDGQGLVSTLNTLLAPIKTAAGAQFPAACNLTSATLPSTIELDSGAVTIEASTATITVSLVKLLKVLKLDINNLPPNTDLLAYVLNNLGTVLSKGLTELGTGLTAPLEQLGEKCLPALGALGDVVSGLLPTLNDGVSALQSGVVKVAESLTSATSTGLSALTTNLAKVIAIGVNVQQGAYPLSSEAKPKYKFTSKLKATPDQATSVVSGQGVERALEIDLLNVSLPTAASESARSLNGNVESPKLAAAVAADSVASLALGNAAAGPSTAVTSTPTSSTPTSTTATAAGTTTAVPTGIPAGQARPDDGTPALPLVLVLLALLSAGGGAMAFRFRTRQSH